MNPGIVGTILGTALVVAPALGPIGDRFAQRAPRASKWVLDAAGLVFLLLFAAWVYEPLVRGHAPGTFDNNYGFLKTVETEDLLRRHQLFGWSDFENSGFPANMNYPMAGGFLEAALHALPGVSLERAHAWCVLFAMVSMMLACAFAGRLHFGRAVGVVAGLLALLDPGAWWVGGHFMTVEVGMWIQTVSTAFVVAGLALWPCAVEGGRARTILATGVLFGVAVLFHPQAILLASAAGFVMLLALFATPKPGFLAVSARTAAILAVTLFTCAFWLVQYLENRAFADFPKVEPVAFPWMWDQFIGGGLLRGPGLWMGVAVAGAFSLAARPEPFGRFLAIVAPGFAIFFSIEVLQFFHLRSPSGEGVADTLQLSRMYYLQRPLALLLAAYALGQPLWSAICRFSGPRFGLFPLLTRLLVAYAIWVVVQQPNVKVPGLPANPVPAGLAPERVAELDAAFDAAKGMMRPGERVVLRLDDKFNHELVRPAAVHRMHIMKIGGDAAMMFKNKFSTEDPDLLARVGSSVLISKGGLPPSLAALRKVASFGDFEVREVPRLSRAWLTGPGSVEILSWKDEEVKVRVKGSRRSDWLRFGIGYFSTWRTDDGVFTVPFDLQESKLCEIPARDGEITLRYHAPASQRWGLVLSVVGWGAIAAALRIRARRRQVAPWRGAAPLKA